MDRSEVLVSVRGRAEELVDPDRVTVRASTSRTGATKREALGELGAAVDRLEQALTAAQAVPSRAATRDAPWTWAVRTTTTAPEYDPDPSAGIRATGRTTATVSIVSTLADLTRLTALATLLDAQEGLHVHDVSWAVDPGNPAWRRVRTTAVAAAVERARDYAAALGGRLSRLEHLADTGLLGDGSSVESSGVFHAASSGPYGSPPLDPEPQPVVAQVEARFSAGGIVLDDGAGAPETPSTPGAR